MNKRPESVNVALYDVTQAVNRYTPDNAVAVRTLRHYIEALEDAPEKQRARILPLALSVHEFGLVYNQILDAFERGESTVPTALAVKMLEHVETLLRQREVT